jgi:hypothetical protein
MSLFALSGLNFFANFHCVSVRVFVREREREREREIWQFKQEIRRESYVYILVVQCTTG